MTRRFDAPLRRFACTSALLAGVCAAVWSPATARAADSGGVVGKGVVFDPPARLVLGAGLFNFDDTSGSPMPDNNHSSIMLRGEYRSGRRLFSGRSESWSWGVGPHLGGLINGDSGALIYAGLFADLIHKSGFFVSPALSAGLYTRGDGRDLGGAVEFEEAVTLGWELKNQHRIGVTLSHISNGNMYAENPGVETVMLNYSINLPRSDGLMPGEIPPTITAIPHYKVADPTKDSDEESPDNP